MQERGPSDGSAYNATPGRKVDDAVRQRLEEKESKLEEKQLNKTISGTGMFMKAR